MIRRPTADDISRTGKWTATVAVVALLLLLLGTAATAADPTKAVHDDRDETTLVGAMGGGYDGGVYTLDEEGMTTWSHTRNVISIADVSRTDDGRILATYQDKQGTNVTTGVRIIDPSTNSIDWQYRFSVETALNSEVHDAEELPNGNIVIADMDRERIFIVNRSTKAIEWQWNASDHYEAPEDPLTRDWLHINDVDRIGEESFLISVRNANQLLIIERGAGVVEVINEDETDPNDENCRGIQGEQLVGPDPKCGDVDVLNHQHNPQWLDTDPARVLVADSENDRAVELVRNETTDSWTVAWEHYQANGIRYDWPRDADRLPNGNTLILDTRNKRLVEIAPNGSTMWATNIPAQGYDADRRGTEFPVNGSLPPNTGAESQERPPEQPLNAIGVGFGALQHVAGGAVPFWVTEWHALAAAITLLCVLVGGLLWISPAVYRLLRDNTRSDPSPHP